jgi:hypothetical protein
MKIKNKWINGLIIFTLTLLVAVPSIGYPVGTFWNNPIVRGVLDASGATTKLGTVVMSGSLANTVGTAITAGTTQTQAGATLLTKDINDVTTVGSAGDGVRLPSAIAGTSITVKNSGVNILAVYPFLADSIDALAVNLPIRVRPGSVVTFFAKNTIVWESNSDTSFTLNAPTTAKGQLELKAADSAGNTLTQIINASQAGARTYTIPDAGSATANFVLSEGAATINGAKTFSSALKTSAGVGTVGAGTVTAAEYGSGKEHLTILTLTNFVVGTPAGGAAEVIGNKIYSFPAGYHLHSHIYSNVGFTIAGTGQTPVWGIGSVVGSGAFAVLNGTATFMDYITEQTAGDTAGTADPTFLPATAGLMTGISLNKAGDVKDVFLNAAETWAADNNAVLYANGTITIKWTDMD